jgi:hypothetical protein
VSGIVWFDRNDNGAVDAGEWPLPGVSVRLVAAPLAGLTSEELEGRPPAMAALGETLFAVTAGDGSYSFSGLPDGAYTVTAAVDIRGFRYTSDTDGRADWQVQVQALAGSVAVADFAGLGAGGLTGQVYDELSTLGLGGAAVRCTWAGPDDVAGTADDVTFSVTASADGTFDLAGVPYGRFRCTGLADAGRTSASVDAEVLGAVAVRTALPVPPADDMPARLAFTGAATQRALVLALVLLVAGTAIELTRLRRRAE